LRGRRSVPKDLRVTIELRSPGARAFVEPGHGGRLHQLLIEVEGAEEPLLVSPPAVAGYAAQPLLGGCYPMAPWPNRIREGRFEWGGASFQVENGRDNGLHGLVLDQPWQVVARAGRVVEMTCDLGPLWPWEGRVWQRVELGTGYLAMKMEVRSARLPFPAGCGWHPWFRRAVGASKEVAVTMPAARRYELAGQLPTGSLLPVDRHYALDGRPISDRRLDECYTDLGGNTVLDWGQLRLTVETNASHMQVYTTDEAVCIEPQTCPPDAFNLGDRVAIVEAGRPLALHMRWTWEIA